MEPIKIPLPPDSELAHLLAKSGSAPLLVETGGVRYRIIKEESSGEPYDAERVKAVIVKTAGSWHDIDTDALISGLYRNREAGSRPITRP